LQARGNHKVHLIKTLSVKPNSQAPQEPIKHDVHLALGILCDLQTYKLRVYTALNPNPKPLSNTVEIIEKQEASLNTLGSRFESCQAHLFTLFFQKKTPIFH